MKERTFYTINLDVTRIFILLAIFFGFLAYFFFLGRSTASKDKQAVQKIVSEPKETKPEVKDVSSPEEKMSGTDLPKEKGTETIELKTKTDPAKDTPAVVEVKEDSAKTLPQPKAELTKTIAPAKQINRRYYKKKNSKNENQLNDDKIFYTIQLGAFSSQEQANKFKENVMAKNKLGAKYVPMVQKNSDYFVVRFGRSNSKEELEKIIQNLDPKTQGTSMILSSQKQ